MEYQVEGVECAVVKYVDLYDWNRMFVIRSSLSSSLGVHIFIGRSLLWISVPFRIYDYIYRYRYHLPDIFITYDLSHLPDITYEYQARGADMVHVTHIRNN